MAIEKATVKKRAAKARRRVSARATFELDEALRTEEARSPQPQAPNYKRWSVRLPFASLGWLRNALVSIDRNALNWSRLRVLGELQVLTRASYLILFVVPVVAALWSPLYSAINRYEQRLSDIRDATDRAGTKLKDTATEVATRLDSRGEGESSVELAAAAAAFRSVAESTDAWLAEHRAGSGHISHAKGLPLLLTLSFIASLLVLIGQLTYQAAVPDPIRESNLRSFIAGKLDGWKENNSLGLRGDAENLVEKAVEARIVLPEISKALERIPVLNQVHATNDDDELAVYQGAAAAEYALEGLPKPVARICVALCYSVAVGIILYVLSDRTWLIFSMTDWPWN